MRITIVGGGIIGLCAAVTLLVDGHAVTLVDADHTRSAASWGNAGHLATEQVAPLASMAAIRSAWHRRFANGGALDLPLAQVRTWLPFVPRYVAASGAARFTAGRHMLAALLEDALAGWQRMAADIGDPGLVRSDGHYVVWESPATARSGEAAWAAADTGAATLRHATLDDVKRVAAMMAHMPAGMIRFEGSGQIANPARLAIALESAIRTRGGIIVRATADLRIERGEAFVPGFPADLVLLAAGVGSGSLIAGAGHRAPLIAERGYHIRAAADDWPEDMPPIVFEDRSMIVTRYADCVQAASFVEFSAIDAPPDRRKWERLERHVRELGLPLAGPFTRWMGARPTLPDYLPAIGRSRRIDNLLYAFGHQHLGLTLAPVTAGIVAALARGDMPAIDIAPLAIERFSRG